MSLENTAISQIEGKPVDSIKLLFKTSNSTFYYVCKHSTGETTLETQSMELHRLRSAWTVR